MCTNAGWIDNNAYGWVTQVSGRRVFEPVCIFIYEGTQEHQGEQRQKERDNVFGQGSRAPIAITVLVKNPNAKTAGKKLFLRHW